MADATRHGRRPGCRACRGGWTATVSRGLRVCGFGRWAYLRACEQLLDLFDGLGVVLVADRVDAAFPRAVHAQVLDSRMVSRNTNRRHMIGDHHDRAA
jgi:hypothetical protein